MEVWNTVKSKADSVFLATPVIATLLQSAPLLDAPGLQPREKNPCGWRGHECSKARVANATFVTVLHHRLNILPMLVQQDTEISSCSGFPGASYPYSPRHVRHIMDIAAVSSLFLVTGDHQRNICIDVALNTTGFGGTCK